MKDAYSFDASLESLNESYERCTRRIAGFSPVAG